MKTRRNLRRIHEQRGEGTVDDFVTHFDESGVPKSLILVVHAYLQQSNGIPDFAVLPLDTLDMYIVGGLMGESLFEIFDEISFDYQFPVSSYLMFREIDRPMITVEDLVSYLTRWAESRPHRYPRLEMLTSLHRAWKAWWQKKISPPQAKDPSRIIRMLLDEKIDYAAQHDAILGLRPHDVPEIEATLAMVACNPGTAQGLAIQCAESLALIWAYNEHADIVVLEQLSEEAFKEAFLVLRGRKGAWDSMVFDERRRRENLHN